ncbi:MAG: ParB N-terminal domain-containing protein [Patescibacteria group bacterium]
MKKIKGRGLQALIPIKPRTKSKRKKENVYYVEIRKIRLTPEQFKEEVNKKVLKDLTESIKKYGVIQPLALVKVEKRKKHGINVYYKLLEGRKRFLAAKEAGLRVVPAKIKKNDQV